jgi:hypothetical protein
MFRSFVAFTGFFVILLICAAAEAQDTTTLADAVKEFNQKAARNSIGKDQPPLTEDEVVASIRGWDRKRIPVSDRVYIQYQIIADTKMLPDSAKLEYTTRWEGVNGYDFEVWWVDLSIPTQPGEGYTFRIRDRKLRSWASEAEADHQPQTKNLRPRRILPPAIDAKRAGKLAIEEFDTNKDGKISGKEFDKVPSLKSNLKRLDADGDGAVTAEEIANRIKFLHDELKIGRMSIRCIVLHNGQPLEGAEVKFVPEKFLGKNMKVARGTTDGTGMCRMSIDVGPDDFPGVYPGLPLGFYRVEITKAGEKIPAKYNTATTLGVECSVDNMAIMRGIKFDLKY